MQKLGICASICNNSSLDKVQRKVFDYIGLEESCNNSSLDKVQHYSKEEVVELISKVTIPH